MQLHMVGVVVLNNLQTPIMVDLVVEEMLVALMDVLVLLV
jgi:hypothetical protein